jgi:hypothetical protein
MSKLLMLRAGATWMREELASVLALAAIGGLSSAEVAAWVDSSVASCEEPPAWLLEASLARTPEDRLHHLREGMAGTIDGLLRLDAGLLAVERGRLEAAELAHFGLGLMWDDVHLPSDVRAALYDLDEEACCAHMFDGQPQPERVALAVQALRATVSKANPRHSALEALAGKLALPPTVA